MEVGEFPFSAGFRLYPPNGGESVYFTVHSGVSMNDLLDSVEQAQAMAEGRGFTLKPSAGHQKRTPLDGVVVGQYNDGKTGQIKKSLHFYPAGEHLNFKVGTLYPENFDKLPTWVADAIRAAKTQPVMQAGDKDTMRKMGVYITLPRTLIGIEEVRTDQDGNPILSEKGTPRYKLVGFAGGGDNGALAPTPPEAKPQVKTEVSKQPVKRVAQDVVDADIPF